jgi:hypothetical protein
MPLGARSVLDDSPRSEGVMIRSSSIHNGWFGARVGKRLPHGVVRAWTLLVTAATTIIFFVRAYG